MNLRPRRHRTAILLHLLERGYLEKGYVTYFGDDFADHDSVDKINDRIDFIEKLESKTRLLSSMSQLKKITPLLLDKDASLIRKDLWQRKPGQVDFLLPENKQLSEQGIDTYFEIVTETWFTDNSNLYLTEKTIRPIIRLQPFIHVGSPFLLEYLRHIGFQTFSPFIDESYDRVIDPIKRMELLFKEIDRLCQMSLKDIHAWYCKLWPRLKHNNDHFNHHMLKYAKKDIRNHVLNRLSGIKGS